MQGSSQNLLIESQKISHLVGRDWWTQKSCKRSIEYCWIILQQTGNKQLLPQIQHLGRTKDS